MHQVASEGPGANLDATVHRAVLGGTRLFEGGSGQIDETNPGLNQSEACNLRIASKLKKRERERL